MRYQFGDIEIDKARFELRRAGEPVQIEPLTFDLLLHFVQNPERVFSRDELIKAVWSGRIVSDATVSGAIKNLRKAIGDNGDAQKYLQTVHGRGFRFSVRDNATTGTKPTPGAPGLGIHEPALVILPPQNLDIHSEEYTLANSLVSDLERILTRIPLLRISAQASRYAGTGLRPTARQMHDEIDVHFILEIGLRQQTGMVRVNAQLTDARAGFRVWADQFSQTLEAAQAEEQLVIAIIARLEPELNRAIYQFVRESDEQPGSRQLYLQANGLLALKGWHEDTFVEAAELLRRSIALDAHFALAWAHLALLLGFGHRIGLITEREPTIQEVNAAAAQALDLDNMDSTVLGYTGCAYCDIGLTSRGIPILKNAISRNPANGQAWAALGAAYLAENDIPRAVEHLQHGVRISPLDSRLSVWGALLALSHFLAGDSDEGIRQAEIASAHDYKTYLPRVVLAAIHLSQQHNSAAMQALDDAYRIKPDLRAATIIGAVGTRLGKGLMALRTTG